jgi:hypothetical protein
MPTIGRTSSVHDDTVKFHNHLARNLKIFAKVKCERILDKFTNFSHKIGEAFELESDSLRNSFKIETLLGLGLAITLLAVVFVGTVEGIDLEEIAHSFHQGI